MSATGKHGPTLQTWRAMRDRCSNPKATGWSSYGGRGIKVCARWNDSFEAFLADMGKRPDGLSIDRIDNNGHYEPGNCRWATPKQQCRNTRANVVYAYQGEELCVSEIAERAGVDAALLTKRLSNGWSIERGATEPAGAHLTKEPYTRTQIAMRDFRFRRQDLEASGFTADQMANRAFDPAMNEPRLRSVGGPS
jgi:hypothetical protein